MGALSEKMVLKLSPYKNPQRFPKRNERLPKWNRKPKIVPKCDIYRTFFDSINTFSGSSNFPEPFLKVK